MGGSSSQTIGYKYFLGVHMALCHGPIDNISKIEIDGRIAWEGIAESGTITIDAPELFGGDKREGGVSGVVDVEMGETTQTANTYLSGILGTPIPSFRGICAVVLNQCYMGNNPYMKPWAIWAQRVFKTTDGAEQWYSAKAAIGDPTDECGTGYACDAFRDAVGSSGALVWPAESSTYVGGVSRTYEFSELNGGAALPVTGPTTHSTDPVIPDACYESWDVDVVAGFHSALHSPGGSTVNGVGTVQGAGFLARFILDNTDGVFFAQEYGYTYSTAGGGSVFPHHLRLSNLGASDQLEIYFQSATGTNTYTQTWASIGVNPLVHHWYHIETTLTTTSTSLTVTVDLYVDGVAAISKTFTKTSLTTVTGGLVGDTAYAGHIGIVDPGRPEGFFNTLYYGQVDLDLLKDGWDRNQADYTLPDECLVCVDMNPAHIIRECLTDTNWGMGYTTTDIDSTSFEAAADALWTEALGMSLQWQREMPIEDFLMEVLRHIDAVLYVDRQSGKFVLNLIRDDFDAGTILSLGESTVKSVANAMRAALGELISSITVQFWDRSTGEDASLSVHDQALISAQGSVNSTTVQYPGITQRPLASRLANRDLKSLSTPLLSCDIEASRVAADLNIGDPFVLDWPDLGIDLLVMRVQQISLGDGLDNVVKITCVEDVFSLPASGSVSEPADVWVDPTENTPADADPVVVTEAPYYELAVTQGEVAINTILDDDADAGFLLAAAGRINNEINAQLHVDSGDGYADSDVLDFSPYCYLQDGITPTDSKIYYTGGVDLDEVEAGTILEIGGEIIRYDSAGTDVDGDYFNCGRGCLDTVPVRHFAGVACVFWGDDVSSDGVQYTTTEELDVKVLTVTPSAVLDIAAATLNEVTMGSRAIRPYPPGDLKVDAVSYPADTAYTAVHALTWVHRDRLQQTSGTIYDHFDATIGPEASTTYTVEVYSTLEDGTTSSVWLTATGITGTSWTQSSGTAPTDALATHYSVKAVRGGYDSWQAATATVWNLAAPGSNLTTENSDNLTTENADSLTLEN